LLPLCFLILSCSTDSEEEKAPPDSNVFRVTTNSFTLQPGEEKYRCYTQTVAEDMYMHAFSIPTIPGVHHMFLARTLSPEQDGEFECNELFRTNWLPLFTTGQGGTELRLPEGSGFKVEKGSQLLVQLHLLNPGPAAITDRVTVNVELSSKEAFKREAALFPFGTTKFEVPPRSKKAITHECVLEKDFDVFAVFPHMHRNGFRMKFEYGDSFDAMNSGWDEPWDFDNQQIFPRSFRLTKGQKTRLTCEWNNTLDVPLKYGEETDTEMCFFSVFVAEGESLDGHCVDVSEANSSPGGGGCVKPGDAGNAIGVGTPCTKGGGECKDFKLTCLADFGQSEKFCSKLFCKDDSECGPDAVCHKDAAGSACIPARCAAN
jgi:hypothetical protein